MYLHQHRRMARYSGEEHHLVAALSGANPLNLLMAGPILPRGQGRGEGGNETVALFSRRLLGDDIPVVS